MALDAAAVQRDGISSNLSLSLLELRGRDTCGTVNAGNFASVALDAFPKIDINKDGKIERPELEFAVNENPRLDCAGREAARLMLKHYNVVSALSVGDPMLQRADLQKFDKIMHGHAGFWSGYATKSIWHWTETVGQIGVLPGLIMGGVSAMNHMGESVLGGAGRILGGAAAPFAIGAAIGTAVNYYTYRRNFLPEVDTFLMDLGTNRQIMALGVHR